MNACRRRVAITGIGLMTPLGKSAAENFEALGRGRSGIDFIEGYDVSGFPTRIAGQVKSFDAKDVLGTIKVLKHGKRDHLFGLAAAAEALRDSGLKVEPEAAARWACVVGSGLMGVEFQELKKLQETCAADGVLHGEKLAEAARLGLDPLEYCRSQPNAGLSLLLRYFGIKGYASSVHTACASGGQAVGTAMRVIRRGTADFALAGGFDSMVNPVGLSAFCLLGALSTDNDDPPRASRPFDRTRNGFVLGEGAGFLVLEEWTAARRRGARIYAELAGDGNSLSSYRITDSHPSGDGPIQAMRSALRDAGCAPEDVDYLNAHGTSTVMNDQSECAAVRAVFGSKVDGLAVSSTKSVTGHLIAAAGAVEAAYCALSIHHGFLPMNANLRELDPACDLSFILGAPRDDRVRVAMSNSFGFGGSNSCLVFRHPDETPE